MATLKSKYFKLGQDATLFVDASTQKKIVGNQIVEFEPENMRSLKFREAVKGGHIVETEPEIETKAEPTEREKFVALTKDKMLLKLRADWNFDEAENKELDKSNKEALIAKYDELVADDSDDEDDDEDSEEETK